MSPLPGSTVACTDPSSARLLRARYSDAMQPRGFAASAGEDRKGIGYMFLGGLSSSMAAVCTHPVDLVKVRMQTNRTSLKKAGGEAAGGPQAKPPGMFRTGIDVVKVGGLRSLYGGLTASLSRQLSYSTVRFGAYDILKKQHVLKQGTGGSEAAIPIIEKIAMAMAAGAVGGVAGNPFDVANVRMQNDRSLPEAQRRNYRHVGDAVTQMVQGEGVGALYRGVVLNVTRAMLMTAGQLATYDKAKSLLLTETNGWFIDDTKTHLVASVVAAGVATFICQPAGELIDLVSSLCLVLIDDHAARFRLTSTRRKQTLPDHQSRLTPAPVWCRCHEDSGHVCITRDVLIRPALPQGDRIQGRAACPVQGHSPELHPSRPSHHSDVSLPRAASHSVL